MWVASLALHYVTIYVNSLDIVAQRSQKPTGSFVLVSLAGQHMCRPDHTQLIQFSMPDLEIELPLLVIHTMAENVHL